MDINEHQLSFITQCISLQCTSFIHHVHFFDIQFTIKKKKVKKTCTVNEERSSAVSEDLAIIIERSSAVSEDLVIAFKL
jgi:hypothetical protein